MLWYQGGDQRISDDTLLFFFIIWVSYRFIILLVEFFFWFRSIDLEKNKIEIN